MQSTLDQAAWEALRSFLVTTPAAPLVERYRVERLLKRGASHATFLAFDLADNETVVLRLASAAMTPAAQTRIAHDAAIAGQIRSPCLAPLRHFSRQEHYFLWARPFIPGASLLEFSEQHATLERTLDVCRSLFTALRELHDH